MRMSVTEFKKFIRLSSTAEIKKGVPIDVTADGEVVATLVAPGKSMLGTLTKCPNCKTEFKVMPSDGKPFFFTMRHP